MPDKPTPDKSARDKKTAIKPPVLLPYGDGAILISYDTDGYCAKVNDAVHALAGRLRANGYWDDVVTGYDTVLVRFDPAIISVREATKTIHMKLTQDLADPVTTGRTVDIPVYYGGPNGPDMSRICASSGLSAEQVIARHSAETYRVCMMGFVPGFAFLSEAPQALHHPRHKVPRQVVPGGSVGIAGWQTGIYGLSSPGGWQIIGRTPLKIFDRLREDPFLLRAGDHVRFVSEADPEIFNGRGGDAP